MKILQANRIAPDGTPRSAASHLGLCCLPGTQGLKELKTTHLLTLKHFLKPIRNILGNATDTEDAMHVKVVKVPSRGTLTYWVNFTIFSSPEPKAHKVSL